MHARFARLLAASEVRFSSEVLDDVAEKIDQNDCRMTSAAAPLVSADLLPFAKAYASEYCRPFMKLIEDVLEVCDGDEPPPWCDDEQALLKRMDLDGYFGTLTAELQNSTGVARESIMDMILAPFSAHMIGDFGDEPPHRWATDAAAAYVPKANFEQVISVVERLQGSWIGLPPGVVVVIRQYLQGAMGLSMEQQERLEAMLQVKFSDD